MAQSFPPPFAGLPATLMVSVLPVPSVDATKVPIPSAPCLLSV
eukprot:CAMPEP_0113530506 /NCGR_PEP_ID=MMETSP0015_2-20120614/2976_1 /TAXON_ID=2838 /ORGANISM="Odontella" /LENGTH=42 /DNA_ID=CAMNT_0000429233 /DNA_START=172 /DNA_END=296 /DNA_ORIENTATION=+ /assembly_acc=CAM_ASM_000160